jgi:predicted TIM-barrel fold metal-dependent hydrolase
METVARYKASSTELTTERLETVQETLRFVQSLTGPQAEAIAGQLERLVLLEMALRKLVAAVEECVLHIGRPITVPKGMWDELRAAWAEGRARLGQ